MVAVNPIAETPKEEMGIQKHARTRTIRLPRSGNWRRYDRPSGLAKAIITASFILFIACPLVGMLYFTFRNPAGELTGAHWLALFDGENLPMEAIWEGLAHSLMLVAVTLVIELLVVIPALVLIDVKFPRVAKMMGVLMLMPMAIPAIVLVVGLAPVFAAMVRIFGPNTWSLALAYGIIALPFIYTTINADLRGFNSRTLVQAAESLGASWRQTLFSVLVPCLRRSIGTSMLIATAIALGEFTISSLLNRTTLQTALVSVSKTDVYLSVIITLVMLAATLCVLFAMTSRASQNRYRGDSQ